MCVRVCVWDRQGHRIDNSTAPFSNTVPRWLKWRLLIKMQSQWMLLITPGRKKDLSMLREKKKRSPCYILMTHPDKEQPRSFIQPKAYKIISQTQWPLWKCVTFGIKYWGRVSLVTDQSWPICSRSSSQVSAVTDGFKGKWFVLVSRFLT